MVLAIFIFGRKCILILVFFSFSAENALIFGRK